MEYYVSSAQVIDQISTWFSVGLTGIICGGLCGIFINERGTGGTLRNSDSEPNLRYVPPLDER